MTDAELSITARFYTDAILQNETSHAKGHAVFRELELVELTFAGDKYKKLVFPAAEVEPNASREAGREITYAEVYSDQYRQFKANEAQRASGTPLEEGGTFTRAEIRGLEQMHVHNYEALAALDGQPLKTLGPAGRSMKDKASAYLEAKPLLNETASLIEANKAQADEIASLRARLAEAATIIPGTSSVEQRRVERQLRAEDKAQDKLETDTAKAIDKAEAKSNATHAKDTEKAERGQLTASTDFSKWDDEQLKDFIREETGERPRGNPKHETLVAAAEEIRAGKK